MARADLLTHQTAEGLANHKNMKSTIIKTVILFGISSILPNVHRFLNNTDKINYLKSLNIDLNGIDLQNENLTNEMQKEFIEKLKTNWSYDLLEKSFLKTANEFINDVDNYV